MGASLVAQMVQLQCRETQAQSGLGRSPYREREGNSPIILA